MNANHYNKAVSNYSDRLYGYALGLTGDSSLARDLVQDGYLKLWENRLLVSQKAAKSYLFRVVYNSMIDNYRKNKRITDLQEFVEVNLDEERRNDNKDLLETALLYLKDTQKSAIMLRDYEGYSYKEIARIMNMNLNQIKVLIFRSRRKMRSIIMKLNQDQYHTEVQIHNT